MKVGSSIAACLLLVGSAIAGDPPPTKDARASVGQGTARSAKTVVLEYVAAWNGHNPAALEQLLDPDSIHEDIPAGFRGKGPAQIEQFASEVFKSQPDLKWRLTTIVESGSTVAAEWTWTATYTGDGPVGPVTGQKISARGAAFAVVADGRIRRFVDYYDFASAFPAPTGSSR